jgi:superfamily I DNA/RNA helicase
VVQQLSLFDALAPVPPPSPPGRVLVTQGALAAEAVLLERLGALLAEARRDPSLLALPVRIVVPSRSLRAHVSAAIVRARGRSVAGVTVQTLHGLAFEVLERAGERAPRGVPLFDVLAQRLARRDAALSRGLDGLVDGYAPVAGTVRDLLDAGLEPEHAEAVDEALATDGRGAGSLDEVARARGLVRVAAATAQALRSLGLGRISTLLARASSLLETDPERALPARAILIHGFADATGVATDLLQTLLRRRGAWLILDRPPDPASPGDVEKGFTERFAGRLALAARLEPARPREAPPLPRLAAFEAPGAEAEAREVAQRVRALLAGGARPEGIGVVARDLTPFRLLLARHFRRLGVPFSGVGERGALEPAGRRARALLDLLREGEAVPTDRWLDAVAVLSPGPQVDLRLAFAALGAGRLREVAGLPLERVLGKDESYALPIRQGLRTREVEDDDSEGDVAEGREAYAQRRRVKGARIREAVRRAVRLVERLAGWPEDARAGQHFARLRKLLKEDLGWNAGSGEAQEVFDALEELEREIPAEFPLGREELRVLLGNALEKGGAAPLGGLGGGVQVLAVMEARGRTFEHLFLLGLNRDVFPRGVREDPLLPDDLRRVLERVLPDVPIKRSGYDEERHLFAQLLAAAPAVTLSWQGVDDDGRPVSPSPLVERLRGSLTVVQTPSLWELPASGPLPGPRPADEHAVLAALHAPRRWFARVLPLALGESPSNLVTPAELAAARLAVLDEQDPDLRTPEGRAVRAGLGPYFGFIGRLDSASGEGEPRLRDLYVTHLENLAACPWQLFLGRLLRMEPTPDPLGVLPGIDALLLGNTVHAALDRIVKAAREADPSGPVPWPADEVLDRLLLAECERLLAEEGIFLPGLARALAGRARPFLAAARDQDWAGGALPVQATEAKGQLLTRGGRPVLFKADRVDQDGVWTDYKTGKPISDKKREDVRRQHFLERVQAGTHLQAVSYVLGAGSEAQGRYLYLKPGFEEERQFAVSSGDQDFLDAFAHTTAALLDAWDAGAFFPRVVDPTGRKEPGRCGYCAVAEACVRGDSGARQRLFAWTEDGGDRTAATPAEAALLGVWRLAGPHPPAPSPVPTHPPSPGEGEKSKLRLAPPLPAGGKGRVRERGPGGEGSGGGA